MRIKGCHSVLDLHEKARLALSDGRTVTIAIKADSPNSAENIAKRQKFGKAKRLAVAALARLRKKSLKDFWKLQEVVDSFRKLTDFEQKIILAELPENIRTALVAKRKRK